MKAVNDKKWYETVRVNSWEVERITTNII